jgi:trans-AT polyketide synthase/acyltransferase/oxidoreductase domain-containing protein
MFPPWPTPETPTMTTSVITAPLSPSAASVQHVTSYDVRTAVERFREPVRIVAGGAQGNRAVLASAAADPGEIVLGTLPPLYPEWLGDRSFSAAHGLRFPYVAGEMANGIATVDLVSAMAEAGMLGFFGAGGLGRERVAQAVGELARRHGDRSNWGVNLIHSPAEPRLEREVAELLLDQRVPIVSCSAFMQLTPPVVLCSAAGLRRAPDGRVVRRTRIFAKVSRPEVAAQFMSPAPAELLAALVAEGRLTTEEACLAAEIPVATDVTVEADSGGHTDNRPMLVLFPAVTALRDELVARYGFTEPIRIGAGGGIGTPAAAAAVFALGAAYVVTGSINQITREAGLSQDAKVLLAAADLADVGMAPAADMFELGVKLQVLRRGTMFAGRAGQLYEAYQAHPSLDAMPAETRQRLERSVFGLPIDEVWQQTEAFWRARDPRELEQAAADPKHRMALAFRWYLGQSSRWAITGEPGRRADYQIWCGPSMGAFNRWARGSFLADPGNVPAVQIALNILEGAAAATRAAQLGSAAVPVPSGAADFRPRPLR